jgi:nitrite reductase/ring-hydroxylating ferredoxin subunit/ectoine hydroxylase-related dioxygenase (phytanoyl-CoA dioxygenase family)
VIEEAQSSTFVATLSDIPDGGNRAFKVGGKSVLVCRTRSGVRAVANRCSHADSPLEGGLIKGDHLFCPLHGARFDLRDGSTKGQLTSRPIQVYRVRLEGDRILLDLGQVQASVGAASPASTPPASATIAVQADVRTVTENEVAFFEQNGWAFLPGLVNPDLCRAALEEGKRRLAAVLNASEVKLVDPLEQRKTLSIAETEEGTVADIMIWVEWRGATRAARNPYFSRIAAGKTTGDNVRRLFGRDKPVRIFHDMFTCKRPDQGSAPTSWHQDNPNFPLDRNALTIWVALDEITPDMGPVQHLSGSHRCGMLGDVPKSRMDLLEEYPRLARFPISPPHHMRPGDATVHHGLVVHGAAANLTSRPRWSYLSAYFPADARYSGAPNHDTDGFDLKQGQMLDHPSFTLLPD